MKKLLRIILPVILILLFTICNDFLLNSYEKASLKFSSNALYNTKTVDANALFNKTWQTIKNDYYDTTYNNQNWTYWKKRYDGKIKSEDDAKVAIDSMVASLDEPYTRFMPQKDYNDLVTSITAKIYGIGVNIYSNAGKIEVFNVLPSTPAEAAGIKQGDIIISINKKNTNGMNISEVASLVRGAEGTTVEITLLRNGKYITKKIVRKEIKIKNVKSSILDNHIGYIQIISFMGNTTTEEFLEALNKLKNTDSTIIDLRGNTGGLLDNAVFIANMFMDKGNIVEIIYKNGNKKTIKAKSQINGNNKPVVVLVNGASASASEILSGALQDSKRAILVGKKTFGKGLVQKVVPLPNSTGINVTIAKYLTPKGRDINKLGIKPDIEIGSNYDVYLKQNKDIQLIKAKELLSKK